MSRINYNSFKTWIEKKQALGGFNLTEGLYKQLFSDLDPHKKGYLTQNDWDNSFECYNQQKQNLQEVQLIISHSYKDPLEAHTFFSKDYHQKGMQFQSKAVTFENFK